MPLTKDIVINLLSIYLDLDQVSKWAATMTKEKKQPLRQHEEETWAEKKIQKKNNPEVPTTW